MFKYNKDQNRRDSLLDNIPSGYPTSQYFHFKGLNAETLKILLDEKFANPKERQNSSPTIQKFYDFMVKFPEFTAHGYAMGIEHPEYRITIEGLIGVPCDANALSAFFYMFHRADEYDKYPDGSLRCWYD